MNKLVRNMRYACFALMFLLTSCFRNGLEECSSEIEYYSYIKFIYDYNLGYEDLFHKQVSRMDVYLFKEDGTFLQRLTDHAPGNSTFRKGYVMGLPEDYKDVAQFVALGGINENQTTVTNMVIGQSSIYDLMVALNGQSGGNIVSDKLDPIWHGTTVSDGRGVSKNDTVEIPLVKSTNTVRIVLQTLDENNEGDPNLNVNDFSFVLTAYNGRFDAFHQPVGQASWDYLPHYTYNDPETGVVAELTTMRLYSDLEHRLVVNQLHAEEPLLDVNLNNYINALKLQEYDHMSLQEYMDRQDKYAIILFLKKAEGGGGEEDEEKWTVVKISINSWLPRDQDVVVGP